MLDGQKVTLYYPETGVEISCRVLKFRQALTVGTQPNGSILKEACLSIYTDPGGHRVVPMRCFRKIGR